MEVSLSELQKVGDELAATSRHRNFSGASIIYRRQVFIDDGKRSSIFDTLSTRKF